LAYSRGYNNVLILEDDFIFDVTRNELDYFLEYLFVDFKEPWDVVMFAYTNQKTKPYNNDKVFGSIIEANSTAGYLVNGSYLPKLIENMKDAWPKLCATCNHILYTCDRSWCNLQASDRWFYFKKQICQFGYGASDC